MLNLGIIKDIKDKNIFNQNILIFFKFVKIL